MTKRTSIIAKSAATLLLAILLLAATVTSRALLLSSRQAAVEPIAVESIDADAAVARFAGSIRFQTESPTPALAPAAAAFRKLALYLEENYPGVHRALTREQIGDLSLLYTWRGSAPDLPGILFLAHMDVVPIAPGTEQEWSEPPFSGAIADGYVWGRGTLDMKGPVLAILEAVEHLLGEGLMPRRSIYLAFGHDEEIGGNNGARLIARTLSDRGVKLAFTFDEGSFVLDGVIPGVSRPVALIGIAEKGYLSLILTARAPGGHSSMPSHAEAIARLARALDRLESQQMPASLNGTVGTMLDELAPEMSFAQRLAVANRWLFGPILLRKLEAEPATNAAIRTTTALTMIKSGVKDNVLPREAAAVVNFRILPGDTVASVTEHVRAAIDDPGIEIREFGESHEPSPIASETGPGFALLRSAIKAVFPDAVAAAGLVIPSTDTRHYLPLAESSYRFEPVRMNSADLLRLHGTNERISIPGYVDMVRFYIAVIRRAGA